MVIPADLTTLSPVRGMFLGSMASFAKHCAPFPKSLGAEEAETLNAMLEPVSDFFAKLPSAKIDEEHKIPDEVLAGLRELGLWGLQIPEQYGGLGLSNTAYARTVEEFVFDPSVAVTLMAHQSIGLKGILLCGNEAQKQKYLPPLASGEKIAAFALTEPSTGSDAASVTLTATPVDGGKAFVLNGRECNEQAAQRPSCFRFQRPGCATASQVPGPGSSGGMTEPRPPQAAVRAAANPHTLVSPVVPPSLFFLQKRCGFPMAVS